MIELSLTKEEAIAMILMLGREQAGYTTDETCCPQRVKDIRKMMVDIDRKLDALVAEEEG